MNNRNIMRMKLFFFGLFALATAAVTAHHFLVIEPGRRCEAAGNWWDPQTRVCATPVFISDITGRPISETKKGEAARARSPLEVR